MDEFTGNGVMYIWDLAGSSGASFTLFPEPHHNHDDIFKAKRYLRDNQDVVSIKIADEADRDRYYRGEIFKIKETKHLKWYEIEQEDKLIRKERKKGTTPQQFVEKFVLPFVAETRKLNVKKFGQHILNDSI